MDFFLKGIYRDRVVMCNRWNLIICYDFQKIAGHVFIENGDPCSSLMVKEIT